MDPATAARLQYEEEKRRQVERLEEERREQLFTAQLANEYELRHKAFRVRLLLEEDAAHTLRK